MKYAIVSTPSYLLLVNLESKTVTPIEGERTEYYGISWFPGGEHFVLSHSGLTNADLADIATYARSEVGWISEGAYASQRFLSAPHQILCAPDGRVVCTNTGRNAISVIDLSKAGVYQEARVSETRWDRLSLDEMPGDHLNSVFMQNDLLFVMAHRFRRGSVLATFHYPEMNLLAVEPLGALTGMHNVWITRDGQRIGCHSEGGALVDLDSKTTIWEPGSPIYTRGLAANKDYVVVGESQKTGRDLRNSTMGGLWILDRHTWRAIDHVCLGPYGVVHEVRLLDVPDEAHHGLPFAGLNKLLGCKGMLAQTSAERLAAARRAEDTRENWRDYELIFGTPTALQDGFLQAGGGELCLLVKQGSDETLSFDFTLDPSLGPGEAHVSAVLAYSGCGGDTDMAALLLQPSGESGASLSVWRHNGTQWSPLPHIDARGLPTSGHLTLETTDDNAVLRIGSEEVVRVSARELGLKSCSHRVGIRWIGAAVRNTRRH